MDNWLLRHPDNTQAKIDGAVRHEPVTYEYDAEHLRFSARAVGSEVGWLEVVDDEGGYWLDDVEVMPLFQHRGIGRQLMRLAAGKFRGRFRVPLLGESSEHAYWLTPEGHALVIRCLTDGIITHEHTDHVPPKKS